MIGRASHQQDDRGTSLILALVFVFAVGVVLVAVGGLAANALLNTNNARVQRTSAEDAETAVNIAMQYVRYIPAGALPSLPYCLPQNPTIWSSNPGVKTANPVQVDCTIDTTATSRVVDFYACPTGQPSSSCETSNFMLHAQVSYSDLNAEGQDNCYTEPGPPEVNITTSCGTSMSLDLWDIPGADS